MRWAFYSVPSSMHGTFRCFHRCFLYGSHSSMCPYYPVHGLQWHKVFEVFIYISLKYAFSSNFHFNFIGSINENAIDVPSFTTLGLVVTGHGVEIVFFCQCDQPGRDFLILRWKYSSKDFVWSLIKTNCIQVVVEYETRHVPHAHTPTNDSCDPTRKTVVVISAISNPAHIQKHTLKTMHAR